MNLPPPRREIRRLVTIATGLLDTISSPADVRSLSYDELDELALELRVEMVAAASVHGGHLASSLGAVELILALHRVLDCPADKLVFDVGHQAYAHKLLTGRRAGFAMLRSFGGLSGFPKITESPYDAHDAGHASDSLSTALGYALARDIDGADTTVAALVGDASFTGGMALEAFNAIGHAGTRMLIVLNDNGMSISRNVGAFSGYLGRARLSERYTTLRDNVQEAVGSTGKVGRVLVHAGNAAKDSFKHFVQPSGTLFEQFGATYIGPIDGHDVRTLEEILADAKSIDGPVVVHAVTTKGKGYEPAERHPGLFHGIGPFDLATGKPQRASTSPSWTDVFSDELVKLAESDGRIVAITAAMSSGTGLAAFAERFPERFYDVGIAEENAVGMGSALALAGKVPVVAVYSTFMQRAYDQLMINVGLQNQHVVLCLDRAGLVGEDGPTHHGAFDVSYLRTIPNMALLAPSDGASLRAALRTAVAYDGPIALRYPRGVAAEPACGGGDDGVWPVARARKLRDGGDMAFLAVGRMTGVACEVAERLSKLGRQASVHDMRWVKPLDVQAVREAAATGFICTLEDNSVVGGFGSAVLEALADEGLAARVVRVGLPDAFVEQGPIRALDAACGLDADGVFARVADALGVSAASREAADA